MIEPIAILNALYDVVFRYMMDDKRVARLVLTAITGENIIDLDFSSTEQSLKIGEAEITVTRMDFQARIRQADNTEKLVLIELQKARLYRQIGRFRRYLGQQYQRNNPLPEAPEITPLPIYPIYILGEPYSENGIPVVRVRRDSYDVSTGDIIPERHPFIEALTHDAIIIQTTYITGKRRTELERFLSIFDQSAISDAKGHILTLNEADFPPAYGPVIRRLQHALAHPQLEDNMDFEDEVMVEFEKKDAQNLAMRQLAEEAQRKQEEAQRKQEEAQRMLVELLSEQGLDAPAIANQTGLGLELVKRLLE